LDGYPLVQRDEAAAHQAAGRFVSVLEELGYFVSAIECGERLLAFGRFQLLDDVRYDIVINVFEHSGEVRNADAPDQVTEIVVFCVFKELANDVARQVVEEFVAVRLVEIEDEFGEVRGME
jgi:hypothetical protein